MNSWKMIAMGLAACLLSLACATPMRDGDPSASADRERSLDLRVYGMRRDYRVHLPPAYDGRRDLPLVVAVHGAFSSPGHFAAATGFDRIADSAGFVVAYPAGFARPIRHWNSGHCCGLVRALGIDDVSYLDAVIADAIAHLAVDASRVYLVGHSNGGMLVYRFVAERPGRVAAAAVVAGTIGGRPSRDEPSWQVPQPARSVPMLVLHGRIDETVAYQGGTDPRSSMGRTWIGARASARFFSEHAGCAARPTREVLHGGSVTREVWGAAPGCRVELHTINGWGHAWPGRALTDELDVGHPLHRFDAASTVWDFFRSSSEEEQV
jgi:polyhydroxybutyrate depolymerase